MKRTSILQGQNALEREKPILYSMQLIPPPLLHEHKILQSEEVIETCPKGFGLKLAKLGLKTPLKK